MNLNNVPRGRRIRDTERGQTLVLVPVCLVTLLAVSALSIDLGSLYYSYQQLQSSTQAAAMAGAQMLPNNATSLISPVVQKYGVATGDLNYHANLVNPNMPTPTYKCLADIASQGVPCYAASGYNVIQVTQTATVNFTFAKLFGVPSFPIAATATAEAAGGQTGPFNIMIVLDSTASMQDKDNDSQCASVGSGPTQGERITCALANIQTFLGELSPCASNLSSCGKASTPTSTTGANVADPDDEVGLMTFPGLCSQTLSGSSCPAASTLTNAANLTYTQDDTNCADASLNPPITSYNNNPDYLIVPLSSNYRTSVTAGLNAASALVIAAGAGGCQGVQAPGGEGTFYAGAISQAQNFLTANARQNTQNVIILISDGDANASGSDLNGSVVTQTSAQNPYVNSSTNLYQAANSCAAAASAAQSAAAAGTWVYAVAYGAEASGCTNDTGTYKGSPCSTMEAIASQPSKFFSDYTSTGGTSSCISAANPTTNLNQIFKDIWISLTTGRLIPNGTN